MSLSRYIFLAACTAALVSCEKEITLPYRSVEPLYVVEGRVTNQGTEVLLSRTRDMEDGVRPAGIAGARVTVAADDGTYRTLTFEEDGYYRPSGGMTGIPGTSYELTVEIGGDSFVSSSRMGGTARIEHCYFQWLTVMKERVLFFTFIFQDIPGEENYYCYRMRRNGENYRWNVMHDRGNDGEFVLINVFCMAEQTAKDNKEEDWNDIIYEGDIIELELQTIDRSTYDYLYSVGLSERTSANPIDNFSGGCLGYFAAYSFSRWANVFSYDNVE